MTMTGHRASVKLLMSLSHLSVFLGQRHLQLCNVYLYNGNSNDDLSLAADSLDFFYFSTID